MHFLGCVASIKQRTILTTCYAAGLRISEAVNLMPSAIDRERMIIHIDQGKGRKDRYVMLSPKLLQVLSDYWHRYGQRMSVPGPLPWAADHPHCGRGGLSSGARSLGPYQTSHATLAPARLRRAFAGSRHQPSNHSVADGPQQPRDNRGIPADRHQQGLCDNKSAGSAAISDPDRRRADRGARLSGRTQWVDPGRKWRMYSVATATPIVSTTVDLCPPHSAG